MQIKTKDVRDIVAILDDIIVDYKEKSEHKKRDWRTYEQRLTERLKKAFKELKPLVHEAVSAIKIVKGETRGSKPQLTYLGKVRLYFVPKRNATVKGPWEWKKMLYYFVKDPIAYLEEYFQRNQSESGIAEDKKRVGWKLGQKREDRIDTANMCTTLWHNLYWLG